MERLRARLVAVRYLLATAWPIVLITAIGLVVARARRRKKKGKKRRR